MQIITFTKKAIDTYAC